MTQGREPIWADVSSEAALGRDGTKAYHVGTLTYTKAALVILFFWLLWGDFCYTLMEAVTSPIMLLKFDKLGASNTEMGVILSTIPAVVYTVLNPVISFKSDRHRGRYGRRLPFILFSLPFIVLCLVALAFSDKLGFWIHARIGSGLQQFANHFVRNASITPNRLAIWTMGAVLIAFTFFNTFLTSVFWYLFNDVVPEELLGRFMSWFRMIGMASASFYQFCIFKYSGTHSTAIFIGAALLYLVGFGLMCLNVREGQYPPPPAYVGGKSGPVAAISTYARECHSLKHYWFQWMNSFIGSIGGGIGVFTLLFYTKAIGLSLSQIGYLNGTISVVVSLLILGSGWLADRFHPIRVVLVGVIFSSLIVTPASMVWLFWHPTPRIAFWVCMAMGIGLTAPATALTGVWDPPLLMRFFPRDRYGQFCSTNAVWRAGGGILGGFDAGKFLDIVSKWVGPDKAYFYIPVWNLAFAIPGIVLFWFMYRSWKQYGGDNYVPPVLTPISVAFPVLAGPINAEPVLA